MDFFEAVNARRSIRDFTDEPVPADVINKALDAALLAPNSSNMQTWEFYWLRDPKKKAAAIPACLSQTAARTAQELIVAAAKPGKWQQNNPLILQHMQNSGAPEQALEYYKKIMPFIYGLQFIAPIKWLIFNAMGLFKPAPRHPWSFRDRQEVCVKSCALACENFMLAISAQGFDTCPMEGFDEARVRKIVQLPWNGSVVMVIAVGKRKPSGVWGEQFRLPREMSVKEL